MVPALASFSVEKFGTTYGTSNERRNTNCVYKIQELTQFDLELTIITTPNFLGLFLLIIIIHYE